MYTVYNPVITSYGFSTNNYLEKRSTVAHGMAFGSSISETRVLKGFFATLTYSLHRALNYMENRVAPFFGTHFLTH